VVAQFGDKTYLATVTVQTTATENPNYVRDCHDNPQDPAPAAGRPADSAPGSATATAPLAPASFNALAIANAAKRHPTKP